MKTLLLILLLCIACTVGGCANETQADAGDAGFMAADPSYRSHFYAQPYDDGSNALNNFRQQQMLWELQEMNSRQNRKDFQFRMKEIQRQRTQRLRDRWDLMFPGGKQDFRRP